MRSMEPVFYTLVSLFTVGQIIFLVPCVMALLLSSSPISARLSHPESVFLFGFNLLLFAPQGYMLPVHDDFVHMFIIFSTTGSVVCLASFFFVDIFRVDSETLIDLEYRNKTKWRIVKLPRGLINGESLRTCVLLGIALGVLGTHLYAFVSLTGGSICVLIAFFLTSFAIYAGRSNWFYHQNDVDGNRKFFAPTSYGAYN